MAAKRTKVADKQGTCKKLVTLLKKRYKPKLPATDRPILETLLYSICLEDATAEQADEAYDRLLSLFHDLNEIRVSSVSELEPAFAGMSDADWRAVRIRNVLQHVFEKYYAFDFEILRRKTLDLANKQLLKVKHLTPFSRLYTMQTALGNHLIPLDDQMLRAAVWLGLVEPELTAEQASDSMKSVIRKADALQFCELFRCLAADPELKPAFESAPTGSEDDEADLETAINRLNELIERGGSRSKTAGRKSKTAKKSRVSASTSSSTNGKKKSAKKPAAKSATAVKKSKTKKKK